MSQKVKPKAAVRRPKALPPPSPNGDLSTEELGRAITAAEQRELEKLHRAKYTITTIPREQLELLWQPTPKHAIRQYPGPGGQMLDYVPHGYVESVINAAFGGDWDYEVVQDAFDGMPFHLSTVELPPKKDRQGKPIGEPIQRRMLTVLCRMTVRVRDPKTHTIVTTVVKSEFGGALWNTGVELPDALKSATSDALKRCGMRFGVALGLYYDDAAAIREYYQVQMDVAQRIQQNQEEERAAPPENPGEMFFKAQEQLGITPPNVMAALNLKPLGDGGLEQLDKLFEGKQGVVLWEQLKAAFPTISSSEG